jgi:hypothetical protein
MGRMLLGRGRSIRLGSAILSARFGHVDSRVTDVAVEAGTSADTTCWHRGQYAGPAAECEIIDVRGMINPEWSTDRLLGAGPLRATDPLAQDSRLVLIPAGQDTVLRNQDSGVSSLLLPEASESG